MLREEHGGKDSGLLTSVEGVESWWVRGPWGQKDWVEVREQERSRSLPTSSTTEQQREHLSVFGERCGSLASGLIVSMAATSTWAQKCCIYITF